MRSSVTSRLIYTYTLVLHTSSPTDIRWFFDRVPALWRECLLSSFTFCLFRFLSLCNSQFFSSFYYNPGVKPSTVTLMILNSSIILAIRIRSGFLASIVPFVFTLKSHSNFLFFCYCCYYYYYIIIIIIIIVIIIIIIIIVIIIMILRMIVWKLSATITPSQN